MTTYKIGDTYTANYANPPTPPERQYPVGQLVYILDKETKEKRAIFEVTATDETKVVGRIVTTYGHKRGKKCAS